MEILGRARKSPRISENFGNASNPFLGSLTLSYTGFFMRFYTGGGGHKVPAAFFSKTDKATAIKLGTLIN